MKPTTPTNEYQAAAQRADRALTSTLATERAAGITAAQAEIGLLATVEITRLESQITAAREASTRAAEQVAARAEQTRRERGAAIASKVFSAGEDGLPALIAAFRREPSRVVAVKCREVWDALDASTVAELGEQLNEHTLASIIIDGVIAESPANVNAVSVFGNGYSYGDAGATIEAVHAFTKAQTPAQLETALAAADNAITVTVARARTYGTPPSVFHRERYAARRSCVTRRDLLLAWEPIDQRAAAATLAEAERNHVPVPNAAEFFTEQVERKNDAAARAFRAGAA